MERGYFTFPSGPFRLTGNFDFPDSLARAVAEGSISGPRVPGVIFCHGFTGNRMESRRMFSRLAERLANQGIACMRFDHRGCGESEGDFIDFTPAGLLEDLDAALAEFQETVWFDPERTAVVGYSLGGLSASYLLGRNPRFRTAVLWAPCAVPEIIRDRISQYPNFEGYKERGYFDYFGFRVSREYLDGIGTSAKPLEWIANYPEPILFCHGADDAIVKPEQTDLFLEARKNPGDRKLIIPDADHGFTTADNIDYLLDQSEQWLTGKLLAK